MPVDLLDLGTVNTILTPEGTKRTRQSFMLGYTFVLNSGNAVGHAWARALYNRYMKKILLVVLATAVVALALLSAQGSTSQYQLPIWSNHQWLYPTLGQSFKVSSGVVDVPVVQGPPGPQGIQGLVGPAGPAGLPIFASNDVYVLSAPQSVFTLKCANADVFRNGVLQSSVLEGGGDYSVSGLVLTFDSSVVPQATDLVKVTYKCSAQ